MKGRIALAVAGLFLSDSGASGAPGPMLDRSQLVLRFEESFDTPPDFYHPVRRPAGRWKTNFFFSIQDSASPKGWESRTLRPNRELQYYGDPYDNLGAFEWSSGSLTIAGRPNPHLSDPRTHALPYLSGLITTERSFRQRYGYFEARVTMPVGQGLWSAFWLLPEPRVERGWPVADGQQELDIFENIGKNNEIYATVHRDVAGKKVADGARIDTAPVDQPHDYGVLVTPTQIVWYVDSREVRRTANTDFHRPAYMLLNLAIGGDWPGAPDARTRFPARMKIDWVRAYALRDAGAAR